MWAAAADTVCSTSRHSRLTSRRVFPLTARSTKVVGAGSERFRQAATINSRSGRTSSFSAPSATTIFLRWRGDFTGDGRQVGLGKQHREGRLVLGHRRPHRLCRRPFRACLTYAGFNSRLMPRPTLCDASSLCFDCCGPSGDQARPWMAASSAAAPAIRSNRLLPGRLVAEDAIRPDARPGTIGRSRVSLCSATDNRRQNCGAAAVGCGWRLRQ